MITFLIKPYALKAVLLASLVSCLGFYGLYAEEQVDHSAHEGLGGPANSQSISTSSVSSSTIHIHNTSHIPLSENNSPSLFKYKAKIESKDQTGLFELVLPLEIMTKVHAGDLKIICSEGQEIPYLMLDGERVTPFHSISATLDRHPQSDGSLITILDVGNEGMMHYGVYLQMPVDAHTGQTVSIYGSDEPLSVDSPKWQENELQSNSKIFVYIDSGSSQQIKKNYVEYKKTRSRYLKVVTKPIGAFSTSTPIIGLLKVEPYNLLGALIQTVPSRYIDREVRTIGIEPEKVKISSNKDKNYTEIYIDLGKDNTFTHEFELKLSDKYTDGSSVNYPQFINKYELERSTDGRNWYFVAEGDIYNLKNEILEEKDLTIDYSETRDRYFRLKIYDGFENFSGNTGKVETGFKSDSIRPEFSDKIQFTSFVRSLVFEIEKGIEYELYFGNTRLTKTFYDRQLLRRYSTATTSEIGLLEVGEYMKNPLYDNYNFELFQEEWLSREKQLLVVLWGILIIGVLIVIIGSYKSRR